MLAIPAGSSLPTVPIEEYRKVLMEANGSIINYEEVPNHEKQARLTFKHKVRKIGRGNLELYRTGEKLSIPTEIGLEIRKSSKNVALSREMAIFIAESAFSSKLREFLKHSKIPDELFYGTVANHLDVPSVPADRFCYRFSMWRDRNCRGMTIRGVCNFAIKDLQQLKQTNCLSANKFNIDINSAAILCQASNILSGYSSN